MSADPVAEPHCPNGHDAVVQPRYGPPWCTECEWNLALFDDERFRTAWARVRRRPPRRWTVAWERRLYRTAYTIDARTFSRIVREGPRARLGAVTVALLVASALLFLAELGLVALAVDMIGFTGNAVLILLGILLLLVAVELRPRFGRIDTPYGEVDRASAPILFGIVDEVARTLGAPPIQRLTIDDDVNAGCGRIGLRRTRLLRLGLPLWGPLSDEARLALLGHELGHLVNGDPMTGLLTQPAMNTFAVLRRITDIRRPISGVGLAWWGDFFSRILTTPIYLFSTAANCGMRWLGLQASREAEYRADRRMVELSGTEAAAELATALVRVPSTLTIVRRTAARSADPQRWRAAVAEAQPIVPIRVAEQATVRGNTSLWATHPPAGLRSRAVNAWPRHEAQLVIGAERWRAADAELARLYERVARSLQT